MGGQWKATRVSGEVPQPGQQARWHAEVGLVDMWIGKQEVSDRDSGRLRLIAREGLISICASAGRQSSVWSLLCFSWCWCWVAWKNGAFILVVSARGSFPSSQMTQPQFHSFLLRPPELQTLMEPKTQNGSSLNEVKHFSATTFLSLTYYRMIHTWLKHHGNPSNTTLMGIL